MRADFVSNASNGAVASLDLPGASSRSDRALPYVEETVELFGNLRQPLSRYVLTFGIGAFDVEEILQEAFLALFKHLKAGKPQGNLNGWLFRVCHNLALKHLDKGRGKPSAIGSEVDWPNCYVDMAPNPEERLLQTQRREKLQSVLRALSEQDRCCICLRAEGLRYREIAEVLGMSLGAVSISLTRSLRRFGRADRE